MLLHHRFITAAKNNAKKLAIADRATGKEIPYERALIASLILASKLKSYEEGFIGIMVPNSAGASLSFLAALISGRTPVMINYSTGAKENAEYAQKRCDFKTIITSKALLEKIDCPKIKGMVFLEDMMKQISVADKVRAALTAKLPLGLLLKLVSSGSEDDSAVILFTSGSEKDPKAVQLTHKNIDTNMDSFSEMFQLTAEDSLLSQLPFFHVFGLTVCLLTPLCLGMTQYTYANPLDFRKVCDIVRDDKPTMMVGTPAFFWGYLKKSDPGDFESLRIMIAGADKCPDALRKAFMEKHGITLLEGYGTTETSPVISANTIEENKPGSVGKAIPGVAVRIEDYETGEGCAVGETGKILIKGPNVMKGYFDDFEETSLRIRHGWYDTGDMGLMDEDGYLWHVGRLKRFVKIGGEMVSLVRVEDVLEKLLPNDVECCVVEVPDAIKGSKIVASVTHPINEKDMLKSMSKQLPNIALPKQFVTIEDLPKMGSGKIDFRTITDMVRDMLQTK